MNTESLPFQDGTTELEAFAAFKERSKKPLVILCHAWAGRNGFICDKAINIADLGFVGFAIDLFGKCVIGKTKEECAKLKKPFIDDRKYLQQRLLKNYEVAISLPYVDKSKIAVLGFGFGGLCALDLARAGVDLSGAISIYGHFDTPKNCPVHPIKTKILIEHGYKDPISTLHELREFERELNILEVDWQTHLYGNSFHAFATPGVNDPANGLLYNPVSAKRSWNEVCSFLKEILI